MDFNIQGEEGNILVRAVWDPDANVWVVSSDEISGLVLESGTIDEMIRKVKAAIPELVEEKKKYGAE